MPVHGQSNRQHLEGRRGPARRGGRKHGISRATYFSWKLKYAGATIADVKQMKVLEADNAKLQRLYADLALENAAIEDVLSRIL